MQKKSKYIKIDKRSIKKVCKFSSLLLLILFIIVISKELIIPIAVAISHFILSLIKDYTLITNPSVRFFATTILIFGAYKVLLAFVMIIIKIIDFFGKVNREK